MLLPPPPGPEEARRFTGGLWWMGVRINAPVGQLSFDGDSISISWRPAASVARHQVRRDQVAGIIAMEHLVSTTFKIASLSGKTASLDFYSSNGDFICRSLESLGWKVVRS